MKRSQLNAIMYKKLKENREKQERCILKIDGSLEKFKASKYNKMYNYIRFVLKANWYNY